VKIIDRIQLINGECLEEMDKLIEQGIKFNLVLTDLPYGTTNRNKWDVVIPFEEMWKRIDKLTYDNSAILLFSDEPFTSQLICSNLKMFKQRITWDKDRGSGFLNAKKMLLKQTEDVCLFYKKPPTYNPQMVKAQEDRIRPISTKSTESNNYGKVEKVKAGNDYNPELRYPTNLIKFSSMTGDCNNVNRLHPTQKPIELIEWLIKTYSNEDDSVLDFTMGSGTTLLGCKNLNRKGTGIELDNTYYEIANKRIG
jgi:site-specific DNA-methyltransferase (adenine-specific)